MRTRPVLLVLAALIAFGCPGCIVSNGPSCSNSVPPGTILVDSDAVYVANTGSSSISAFSLRGSADPFTAVCGSPFQMPGPPTGLGGGLWVPSSEVANLIVLSAPQKTVWLFSVDIVFGNLTGPISTVTTAYTPVALAVWETYFYVANAEGSISAYHVSGEGAAVTELGGSPFPAGSGPVGIGAADPGLLYVANSESNNVSGYTLNPNTGVPTPMPGSPFPAGTNPSSIEVAPPMYLNPLAGATLVIVANAGSNNISVYAISRAGGLTPVPGSPFGAGSAPTSSATGKNLPVGYVYVANSQSNNISGYSIDSATGVLTPLASSPFPAGLHPLSVAVSASAGFVYAANSGSNSLSVYSIDQNNGTLTPVSGSPFAVGNSPQQVLYFQVPD